MLEEQLRRGVGLPGAGRPARLLEDDLIVEEPAHRLDAAARFLPAQLGLVAQRLWMEVEQPLGLDGAGQPHHGACAPAAPALLGVDGHEQGRVAHGRRGRELRCSARRHEDFVAPRRTAAGHSVGEACQHGDEDGLVARAGLSLGGRSELRQLRAGLLDAAGGVGVDIAAARPSAYDDAEVYRAIDARQMARATPANKTVPMSAPAAVASESFPKRARAG